MPHDNSHLYRSIPYIAYINIALQDPRTGSWHTHLSDYNTPVNAISIGLPFLHQRYLLFICISTHFIHTVRVNKSKVKLFVFYFVRV
jgi:hypothetical protein